ncbi:MAG: type II toxin-antitoxin system ParD family antitoxin [Magnetococcales bacterium]|nr:type II toxin-antitoxin system ParD family antitoxin [Magnetococcales bacterium]
MNITLPPHLEALVQGKVASGFYHSVSEVVWEALQLLDERDLVRKRRQEALQRDIQIGMESGEATPLDLEAVKERGRKRLARLKS